MVDGLITLGIAVGAFLMAVSIFQNWRLLGGLGLGRQGVILFLQKLSLKLWIVVILGFVLVGTLIGGFPSDVRPWINLGLVVLLLAQELFEIVTSHRWRAGTRDHG